ncbi:hypothetical protein ACQPU1_06870 [Clostridium paraputrificum]|uniref:hypothetical protein n=1 Tax=Clostridium TaxID=1485 RepID=UPI003D352496
MKKSFRKLLPIGLILVLSFTLMACGKKSTPEESMISYLNLLVNGSDDSETLPKAEKESVLKARDDAFMYMIEGNELYKGLMDDALKKEYMDAVYNGAKITKYSVLSSKIDGDTATVDIEIQGANMSAAFDKAGANVNARPEVSDMDDKTFYIEVLKEFPKTLATVEQIPEKKTVTINVKKSKGYWSIDSITDITNNIVNIK